MAYNNMSSPEELEFIMLQMELGATFRFESGISSLILYAANGDCKLPNLPLLDFLLERDDVTRIEKIEALEVAGAVLLGHDDNHEKFPLAFQYWRRALSLRLMDTESCRPIHKTPLKSGQLSEWSTLDDLQRIEQQPAHQRKIQSHLVRLRVFSSLSWEAVLHHFMLPFVHFLKTGLAHESSMNESLDLTRLTLDTVLRSERPHEESLQESVIGIVAIITRIFYGLTKDDTKLNSENLMKFVKLILMTNSNSLHMSEPKSETPVAEAEYMNILCVMFVILSRHTELITEEIRLSLIQLVHRDVRDPIGSNLLHIASRISDSRALSTVRFLVKLGADLNARDNDGDGVLHFLANEPVSEIRDTKARLLVGYGAHLDMVNKEGMTAADLWFKTNTPEKKNFTDLPDWLQEGVPNLKCLCSRVIRRHKLPYADGAIVPAVLIPFVTLH